MPCFLLPGGNEISVIIKYGHLDFKGAERVPTNTSKRLICLEWALKASVKMCLHESEATVCANLHGVNRQDSGHLRFLKHFPICAALLSRQRCCSRIVSWTWTWPSAAIRSCRPVLFTRGWRALSFLKFYLTLEIWCCPLYAHPACPLSANLQPICNSQ